MAGRQKPILKPEEAAAPIPSGATLTAGSSAARLVPDKVGRVEEASPWIVDPGVDSRGARGMATRRTAPKQLAAPPHGINQLVPHWCPVAF